MEIIKNRFKSPCAKKVKCCHCNSKLKITYNDLQEVIGLCNKISGYYFKCPCCNNTVIVSVEEGTALKNAAIRKVAKEATRRLV